MLCPNLTIYLYCSSASDKMSEKEAEDLMAWMRNGLGIRVANIKVKKNEVEYIYQTTSLALTCCSFLQCSCHPHTQSGFKVVTFHLPHHLTVLRHRSWLLGLNTALWEEVTCSLIHRSTGCSQMAAIKEESERWRGENKW